MANIKRGTGSNIQIDDKLKITSRFELPIKDDLSSDDAGSIVLKNNNLLSYKDNQGRIIEINPSGTTGSTATLQTATTGSGNNITNNALQITGSGNIDLTKDGIIVNNIGISKVSGGTQQGLYGFSNDSLILNYHNTSITLKDQISSVAGTQVSTRISAQQAINNNELPTLGQVITLVGTGSTTNLTFVNGLKLTGNTVRLGLRALSLSGSTDSGILTDDTYLFRPHPVFPNSHLLFGISGTQGSFQQQLDVNGLLYKLGFNLSGNNMFIQKTITLSGNTKLQNISFVPDTHEMMITDNIGFKGFQEAADYSGNKTDYSYVTKKFVIDSLTGVTGNTINTSGNQIKNGDLTIKGNVGVGGDFDINPNVGDPAHVFDITNNAIDQLKYLFQATSYSNSTGMANVHIRKARGSVNSPLAVLNGDALASFGFRGYDGTNFAASSGAIQALAAENFDSTHNGTSLLFQTTPLGNHTGIRVNALKLQPDGDAIFLKNITTNNGNLIVGGTGNTIKMYGTAPFISWYGSDSTTRLGYIQHNGSNLTISTDIGNLKISNSTDITGKLTVSVIPTGSTDVVRLVDLSGKTNSGGLLVNRIPFGSGNNTLIDSSNLLWDDNNVKLTLTGGKQTISFNNTFSNKNIELGIFDFGSRTIRFKDVTYNKTLMALVASPSSGGTTQLGIGDIDTIPSESQLYVYGGATGANFDLRGDVIKSDECNIDLEGSDWDTLPNSIGLSYFGTGYTKGGTFIGLPKKKMGVLRWQNVNNAVIATVQNIPIRFGVNDIEIININPSGMTFQSDFSSGYTSRSVVDKGYVDNKTVDKISNSTDTYTSTAVATNIITLTQTEYDAIGTKNANTLYFII